MIKTKTKKRQKLNKSKQALYQGYSLHVKRLSACANKQTPVRSIKFPLVSSDHNQFNNLFDSIKFDYKFVVGNMNFADWNPDENQVNLLDLWKTAIKEGILIARTEAITSKFYSLVFSQSNQQLVNNTYQEFLDDTGLHLTPHGLELNFLKDQRGDRSLSRFILELFKSSQEFDTFDKQKKQNTKSLNDIPEEFRIRLEPLINTFWQETSLESNPKDTYIIVKEKLTAKYNLKAQKADNLGRAFFQHPALKSSSVEASLDKYEEELAKLNQEANYSGKNIEKDILGGITSNHEGLSNFFGYIDPNKDLPEDISLEVKGIIEKLNNHGLSRLASPADYRSQIGGIVSSYVTNYTNRKEELSGDKKANLEKNLIEIEKFLKDAEAKSLIELNSYDGIKIAKSISEIKAWFEEYRIATNDEIFSILEFELSHLKTRLNLIVFTDDCISNKKKNNSKEQFNKLLGSLQVARPVNFPGDTKKQQFLKFYYAHEIFSRLINFYNKNCQNNFPINNSLDSKDLEKKYRQTLDLLWNKYPEFSTRFKHLVKSFFAKHVSFISDDQGEIARRLNMADFNLEQFLSSSDKDSIRSLRFYCNPRARLSAKEFTLDNINTQDLYNVYEFLKPNWDDILASSNQDFDSRLEDLVSAIEIEKIRSGIKYFLANSSFCIDSSDYYKTFQIENFDRQKYLDFKLFDEILKNGQPINLKFEQILLTTLRAKLSMLSRQEELARYVVNPIKTEEKFPLVCRELEESDIADSQKFSRKKHRKGICKRFFAISLDKLSNNKSSDGLKNLFAYQKDSKEFKLLEKKSFSNLINIQSSVYQTQFLSRLSEKSLDGSILKNWQEIDLGILSYSFIAEEKHQIQWTQAQSGFRYPKLTPVEDSKRVYVSIPFSLGVKTPSSTPLSQSYRYLGIDVGEYGLAYSVIEITGDENKSFPNNKQIDASGIKISNIENGFIHSHLIHKIKDQFRENQNIQRTGTFSRPNTKLALIRENVINSLRNRIHHLVLEHQAIPIYEFEISNFETGSGKVTKIYDSVKRSDPYKKQKVEEDLRKHIWGTKTGIGKEVGAYATSYTCINCGMSHYDIDFHVSKKDYDKDLFVLNKVNDEDYEFEIEGKSYKASMFLRNFDPTKKYSRNQVLKAIKDWARPPSDLYNISEEHKDLRGNSSVYRCPFCKNITDADIQASFNIAVLGYIADVKKQENKNDTESSKDPLRELRRDKLLHLIKSQENIINQINLSDEFFKLGFDYDKYISA